MLQKRKNYVVAKEWPGVTDTSHITWEDDQLCIEQDNGDYLYLEEEDCNKYEEEGYLKAEGSHWVFEDHKAEYKKNSVRFGCTQISLLHINFIAAILTGKETKIPTESMNANSSFELSEVTEGKIKVLKELPGLNPNVEFSIDSYGRSEIKGGTVPFTIHLSKDQIDDLINDEWLERLDESTSLRIFDDGEIMELNKDMSEFYVNGYDVSTSDFLEFAKDANEKCK